jgi:hypothetical protein
VRSSAFANLPEGKRVTPAQTRRWQRSCLAQRESRLSRRLTAQNHYRFIGIEFSSSITKYNYALISFGSGEKSASRVPHDLEIDRCYIHPLKDGIVRRGIALTAQAPRYRTVISRVLRFQVKKRRVSPVGRALGMSTS